MAKETYISTIGLWCEEDYYNECIDIYSASEKGRINRDSCGRHGTRTSYWDRNDAVYRHLGSYDSVFQAKQAFAKHCRSQAEDNTEKAPNGGSRVRVSELPGNPDTQFYPTPPALAGKMFGKLLGLKHCTSALEPSAGKGDLADSFCSYAKKHRSSFCHEDPEKIIDTIELDPNLRMMLKGKGYKVVYDDFLSFSTSKHYDLILMNPPFADGEMHLMKAIMMQMTSGGEIVCLLNAETIRNPYSNRRKMLTRILAENDASIEFVKDAFKVKEAERKTSVEVAIVHVSFPCPTIKSDIWERCKKASRVTGNQNEPEAILSGNWMEGMIQNFQMEANAGVELIKQYSALYPYIGGDKDCLISLKIRGTEYHSTSEAQTAGINSYLKGCRLKYWEMLLEREELTSKMTSDMRSAYRSKIDTLSEYDFNLYNIREVYYDITAHLQTGVKESILKLFETLSSKHSWYPECENNIHYYNGWKTNKAHKVGMKVILPINGFYSYSWKANELDQYTIVKYISDLERAMNFLDNGETEMRRNIYSFTQYAAERGERKISYTYFDAKFFKKGTCHITFHPEAARIIDRLNIFAAMNRSWLPPTYGKVHYENMPDEEKEVISSFHGGNVEEYEQVVATPERYIFSESSVKCLPSV